MWSALWRSITGTASVFSTAEYLSGEIETRGHEIVPFGEESPQGMEVEPLPQVPFRINSLNKSSEEL